MKSREGKQARRTQPSSRTEQKTQKRQNEQIEARINNAVGYRVSEHKVAIDLTEQNDKAKEKTEQNTGETSEENACMHASTYTYK